MKCEFWAIPKDVAAIEGLSLEAKFLFGILWTFKNGANIAWPGQKRLATILGKSKRSIIRYLKELEEMELIAVDKSVGNRTNRYHLRCQFVTRVVTPAHHPSDTGVTSIEKENNKKQVKKFNSDKFSPRKEQALDPVTGEEMGFEFAT